MQSSKLRRVNDILTVLVVCMAGYVLVLPLWPNFSYRFKDKSVPYNITSQSTANAEIIQRPEGNHLLIPSIGMDEVIYEGGRGSLNNGAWLKSAAKPDGNSNTVIVGHRFTYSDDNAVFYHLDKIQLGEVIAIYWNGKEYNYRVREVKVVPATAVEVEAPTETAQLTLYTCTPIWSAKDRLVVVADEIYREEL